MRVLVCSDSHGRLLDLYDAVERETPEAVIHLGDYYGDACELRHSYPDLSVYAVAGNNDWDCNAPWNQVITLEGVRIYLTHGHHEGVSFSSCGHMVQRTQENACQLGLFGHTHIVYQGRHAGVMILNPGSISLPRQGGASYAMLSLAAGQIVETELRDTEGNLWDPEKRRKQKRTGWF
ncbi:MAG: metallophosphoesterase [Butyricicoccus pullicaecorum]|nr:metallophosphoesterase [Butyricicoccus pullicaecorum]